MDRGAWLAPVHGVAQSRTQLSDEHFHFHLFTPRQYNLKKVINHCFYWTMFSLSFNRSNQPDQFNILSIRRENKSPEISHTLENPRDNLRPKRLHLELDLGKFVKMSVAHSSNSLQLMDCSPPGPSVHGIFQARILKWVAIFSSRGSSRPRNRTWVSYIAGRLFTVCASRKATRNSIQS